MGIINIKNFEDRLGVTRELRRGWQIGMLPGKFCAINRSLDEMKFFGKGILEKKKKPRTPLPTSFPGSLFSASIVVETMEAETAGVEFTTFR